MLMPMPMLMTYADAYMLMTYADAYAICDAYACHMMAYACDTCRHDEQPVPLSMMNNLYVHPVMVSSDGMLIYNLHVHP